MKRSMWPWAAGLAVVAIAATHLWAGCPLSGIGIGKSCGGSSGNASGGPPIQGVFRYVAGRETKSPCGKFTYLSLDLVPVVGGQAMRVLADSSIRSKLQTGDLYTMSIVKHGTGYWVKSYKAYEVAAGEDQPGVFVLQRVVEETAGSQPRVGMELTKLGQSCTVWVPNRRGADGTYAPDADLEKEVRGLKKGGPVRVSAAPSGRTLILKSVSPYAPPQEGEFLQSVTQKVGEHEYLGATLKTDAGTVTVLVPGRPGPKGEVVGDRKLLAVVRHLKAGQRVTFEVREADGQTWLEDIRLGGQRT